MHYDVSRNVKTEKWGLPGNLEEPSSRLRFPIALTIQ